MFEQTGGQLELIRRSQLQPGQRAQFHDQRLGSHGQNHFDFREGDRPLAAAPGLSPPLDKRGGGDASLAGELDGGQTAPLKLSKEPLAFCCGGSSASATR
jgi:hypothetical protein